MDMKIAFKRNKKSCYRLLSSKPLHRVFSSWSDLSNNLILQIDQVRYGHIRLERTLRTFIAALYFPWVITASYFFRSEPRVVWRVIASGRGSGLGSLAVRSWGAAITVLTLDNWGFFYLFQSLVYVVSLFEFMREREWERDRLTRYIFISETYLFLHSFRVS